MTTKNTAAMTHAELLEQANNLGLDVSPTMRKGTLERKINVAQALLDAEKAREAKPDKAVEVTLLKHTAPPAWYQIVGHKDENGNMQQGMAPAPVIGASPSNHKIWAGTVVRLPVEDAARLCENEVLERIKMGRGKDQRIVERKVRKPLAEPFVDWSKAGEPVSV